MFKGFKEFALRGNVIDLAVGFVMGAAFAGIIKSMVEDLVLPLISLIIPGEQGYAKWILTVDGKDIPYGKFIGATVTFLIVAFALYIFIVKFVGWLSKLKKEEAAATVVAPAPLSREEQLLTEIRDLLAKERK